MLFIRLILILVFSLFLKFRREMYLVLIEILFFYLENGFL